VSAMDPTNEELKAMTSIKDILDWVGVANEEDEVGGVKVESFFMDSYLAALGKPRLVRQVAAIPLKAYENATEQMKVKVKTSDETSTRDLSPLELGHVGMVRRVCRLLLGLSADEALPHVGPSPAECAGPPTGGTATGSPQTERKVKLSSVLDQGDDSEVRPLDRDLLRGLVQEWKERENEGEDPAEEEEATGDQLTALDFKVKAGEAPSVDFAVWRPFGNRLGRMLKFQAWVSVGEGRYQMKELAGPPSFDEWRSWRVFAFAMTVLRHANKNRLDRYRDRISSLNDTYPGMWWLIATADIRMRSERLERLRRRCAREHAGLIKAGLPSENDPLCPWDRVFRAAAAYKDFWDENVREKALIFAAKIKTAEDLSDAGVGAVREIGARSAGAPSPGPPTGASNSDGGGGQRKKRRRGTHAKSNEDSAPPNAPKPKGGKGKGKGKDNDAKDKEGRYFRSEEGKQICWEWNRNLRGCGAQCPGDRAHVCEWCRDTHRAVSCRAV